MLKKLNMVVILEDIPEAVRDRDIQAAQLVQRINAELDKNKLNMKIMKVRWCTSNSSTL